MRDAWRREDALAGSDIEELHFTGSIWGPFRIVHQSRDYIEIMIVLTVYVIGPLAARLAIDDACPGRLLREVQIYDRALGVNPRRAELD